jgi:Rieske Fe-S protein
LVEPEHQPYDEPHLPAPSLWPIGFAIGIVVALVGLIVNPLISVFIGVPIALIFGFLWARDATAELRGEPIVVEPERREATEVIVAHTEPAGVTRSRFLEGATLGLGGVIGGLITVPVAGFALLPAFLDQKGTRVDLGPISMFEQGQWYITTFVSDPEQGAVSRRTAFIRNNGSVAVGAKQEPSFTIISNHCVHLGCPVQANGPADQYIGKKIVHETTKNGPVIMDPVIPAGYGCPCHGGQYDPEGNRTAGPPVRALDRYDFEIDATSGTPRLILLGTYSVSHVEGTAQNAKIYRYKEAGPGEHIDGPEQLLYPLQPPHN